MVDTDGVGSKSLHESNIESALSGIDERVIWRELVGNTWAWSVYLVLGLASDELTLDEKLGAATEEELCAYESVSYGTT